MNVDIMWIFPWGARRLGPTACFIMFVSGEGLFKRKEKKILCLGLSLSLSLGLCRFFGDLLSQVYDTPQSLPRTDTYTHQSAYLSRVGSRPPF